MRSFDNEIPLETLSWGMTTTYRFWGMLAVLGMTVCLNAQQPADSTRVGAALGRADTLAFSGNPDTVRLRKQGPIRRFFTKGYPNPRKAALLSLVLPGAGQVYNKRWWKLPLVYGALGAAVGWELYNLDVYREARDNYKWKVDGDPNTVPLPEYERASDASVRAFRDQWRRNTERSSIVLGLAYMLCATDAFVDAHLKQFDVSDDLSLRLVPQATPAPGGAQIGLGIRLQWRTERPQPTLNVQP